ncbi:MAG: hypothetical protein MJA29_11095, partial [Candidatus Omnitrophica bacterium]|nr:hypothetical protein [Candidatus Omnitrophota bacterium]
YNQCDAGKLQPIGDIWASNNKLKWSYPGGGIYCCKWKKFKATNCFRYRAYVYKRHGVAEMESTAGEVSNCYYTKGHCSLKDGKFLSWKPNLTEECEYVPWMKVKGIMSGNHWISNDKQLALTMQLVQSSYDCRGEKFIYSEQGIPLRIIYKRRIFSKQHKSRRRQNPELSENRINPRIKRQVSNNATGIVTSEFLAASLQAIEYRYQKQFQFSFAHAFLSACQTVRTLIDTTITLILSNPTLALRQLLRKTNLVALAGRNQVEV